MEEQSSDEESYIERRRRASGPARSSSHAHGAAAPASAAAAAANGAGSSGAPALPTAAHQALLRFLTVNGVASRGVVEEFFQETKDRCQKSECDHAATVKSGRVSRRHASYRTPLAHHCVLLSPLRLCLQAQMPRPSLFHFTRRWII